MALKGIKVIELAGLAPAPFCGMILSDFGAKVIRVDKTRHVPDIDRQSRGKYSVALDLKQKEGVSVFKRLCFNADVLIEPFRAGIMEKLGLGPDVLMSENPRLIYARLTGFGQKGSYAKKAGHDINYLALSGVLSRLGRVNERPYAPINLLADFASGGLLCAFGIVTALLERVQSGKGQVIDANMVEGSAYVANWLWRSRDIYIWGRPRGDNVLDGGSAFYDTYKTADGKYISVGALEPQFFQDLIKGLGFKPKEISQLSNPEEMRKKFQDIFLTKTRDEWVKVYKDLDACVAPVLEMDEAAKHDHNQTNNTFVRNEKNELEPGPAPKLSRTPADPIMEDQPVTGQNTTEVLLESEFSQSEIKALIDKGVVIQGKIQSKM
ncbi:hypothetical protein CHS0354_027589 [Potamilus streckersoni]|uniref:Alpha-methylacyl-CoA racemase n=1 Tax=Potamilus streckersoni TaxID=2493646 RepID=A0AAE0VNL4_9BIVA|nr:hypothetical protein CHS0354_027589 [Potamilus streckersoni]